MAPTRSRGARCRRSTATSPAGTFVFGVGEAPPSTPPNSQVSGTSESGSPPAIAARWILYLGLMALFGAAWIALAVTRGPSRDLLAMAATGWVLTALGTLAVVAVQVAEIGAPLETLHRHRSGRCSGAGPEPRARRACARRPCRDPCGTRWTRLGARGRNGRDRRGRRRGHGPRCGGTWLAPQFVAQSAHGVRRGRIGRWACGPPRRASGYTAEERLAARDDSRLGRMTLAIVVTTGAAHAFAEIGTLTRPWHGFRARGDAGRGPLLLVLAGLGAFNPSSRCGPPARGDDPPARSRRGLALAIAVIGLSACSCACRPRHPLPARSSPPPSPSSRAGTTADLVRAVDRGRRAHRCGHFDLALTDYDSGAPFTTTIDETLLTLLADDRRAWALSRATESGSASNACEE